MEDRFQRVDVGGHCLRVARSGTGPPHFLCLHGLVDRIETFDPLAALLREHGSTARVDQRGHGESEAPPGPYRREDLARDAAAVVGALGAEATLLIGHSMGGIVAMTAALEHPECVAGLVLIGTASQCNARTAAWYERIATAGEQAGLEGLARAIYGEKSRKRIEGQAQGIAHVTRALASLHPDPLTPKLASLSCPVLLVVGERDPMGPRASEILAEQIPHAELVVVPDCGHWVHVEQPGRVMEAIERFLPQLGGR